MNEQEPLIRRILIALDASPHSLSALEAAAELAAGLRAELLGLFVEDINVLRTAALPSARAVGSFSAALHRVNHQSLERGLRAETERARRALRAAAERAGVRWSFRVARGLVAQEILAAGGDMVVLGKSGWSPGERLGSTVRAVLSGASGPVLVLGRGTPLDLPVVVAYDGSAASRRALALAAQLARERGGGLTVFLLTGAPEDAAALRAQADRWLRERRSRARFRPLDAADPARLVHAARTERSGVLVLPVGKTIAGDALIRLLGEAESAVLLVW